MKTKELLPEEFESVFGLLAEAKLDFSDLKQPNIRLFRFEENEVMIGVAALEIISGEALLRSVAVKPELQGKGFGKAIVGKMEEIARQSGIKALNLLTNTAADFFKTNGFQVIQRPDFAESLKQTTQFAGLCPGSAVCLTKQLYEN